MKNLLLLFCFVLYSFSLSAQRIYPEDMRSARIMLPQFPTKIDGIKKNCKVAGKKVDCSGVRERVAITINLRMDSINMPTASSMAAPDPATEVLLMPEMPDQKQARVDAINKRLDSIEQVLNKADIITSSKGKSDYHQTPLYGKALKDLTARTMMPVFSNSYYHMSYSEREALRDSIYSNLGIPRSKIVLLLEYEKILFEKDKKGVFEMSAIASNSRNKFIEFQTLCSSSIKNSRDSIEKQFSEIASWKTKELAKAKTASEKANINQQAKSKNQKVLSASFEAFSARYQTLTNIYDQLLNPFNDALKSYEFGLNATSYQEVQMQHQIAQAQLIAYLCLGNLADFCSSAQETILSHQND